MKVYRQGDIILREIERPKIAIKVDNVLDIKGETGQSHIINTPVYETMIVRGVKQPLIKFIDVGTGGEIMVHPEHPSLPISKGTYEVSRVRTYEPKIRNRTTYALD